MLHVYIYCPVEPCIFALLFIDDDSGLDADGMIKFKKPKKRQSDAKSELQTSSGKKPKSDKSKKKSSSKEVKNSSLLSFGDEEEEEET